MGVSASGMAGELEGPRSRPRPRLEDIPESCVALVLSYLDPPEIAKMARVNQAFRAASSADFIWIPKLPSNFECIISKLPDQGLRDKGKMEIYAGLSRPSTFDDGTKEVWIDKRSGGVCVAISSKAMTITGIDDRRYWNHIPTDESRFQTVAYLQQIWWLEVDGEVDFHFPKGEYSLFFRLHLGKASKRLGRRVCSSENVHGWDLKPAQFKLTTQNGNRAVTSCMIENVGNWANYHVGEFVVDDPDSSTKVKFSMTQIDCTHTKGGLCVDSVIICPSSIGKGIFSDSVDGEACRKPKSFVA